MPSAAIRVDLRVGRVSQGPMGATALVGCCRPVNRKPGQRMAEPHLAIEFYEPDRGRRRGVLDDRAKPIERTSHPPRVQDRLGRGDQ